MPRGYPCPPGKPFSRAKWREENREHLRRYFAEYRKTYDRHKNEYLKRAIKYMITNARRRAALAKVPFEITEQDIVIPKKCPILWIPIKSSRKHVSAGSPSLDRIRPRLGYVPGNIQVISFRANTLKSDATPEELERVLAFLRGVS